VRPSEVRHSGRGHPRRPHHVAKFINQTGMPVPIG
jgi:hypothetical protein